VIITYRDDELIRDIHCASRLGDRRRDDTGSISAVVGTKRDVARLNAGRTNEAHGCMRTGGNPFYVTEVPRQ
jgi:hypothetical protein